MPNRHIDELRISSGAEDELAGHGLLADDTLEVLWDHPVFFKDKVVGRDLMIGKADDGRILTIVIQQTRAPGVWHVVTGWRSDKGEKTAWENAQPWRTGRTTR